MGLTCDSKAVCQATTLEPSTFDQTSEEIRYLEEIELELAQKLGISGKDVDSVEVVFKAKHKALSNEDYLPALRNLNELHRLRLNRSLVLNSARHEAEERPLPLGLPYTVDASRFWAVLIGIDEYPYQVLHGCVSDVRVMEKYLTEDLCVPRDRIQLLLGSKEHTSADDPMYPSRAHIIGTLTGLIAEDRIKHGDNIIIYYAGHGTSYNDEGHSAFDREINGILTEICRTKGYRITLILDCCHSGGASREVPPPGSRTAPTTRCTTLQDMLLAGDNYLKGYNHYFPGSILARDWRTDMDSHVLVAACKEYQLAKEMKVKREDGTVEHVGIFTDSLLRVLRSGYWRKETTYADLIFGLGQSSHQTPVVAGKHRDARIWYQD
ncbi:caspase domain-containing protein [Desarmillaria tabescens]|uniref:Caspase domain-containing protein n=1 Tax=Armillaria tabescens TaxID=1929756 RepID=A0AA39TPW3_ARMTA|nr:caspase domain-containing protein [Desarmillaria tabescens]KAK0462313.1 caspase domain-containing protein [Desarmillaria tabescens]